MKRRELCAGAALALGLAGCATPQRPSAPQPGNAWSGRMALQVPEQPSQSFSATFELQGSAREGRLALFTPLGATLAQLDWAPGHAVLTTPSAKIEDASVELLIARVTGSEIPVTALFDWLRGIATSVPDWVPDLTQLAQGRIAARRVRGPLADLRVVLER